MCHEMKERKMRTVKYIGALALAAMLATACTNEEETGGYLNDVNAVRVNANLGNSIFSRSNPVGTEDEQLHFNSGDVIAVDNGTQTVKYAYDGSSLWTPSSDTDYLKWESAPITFKAWYPADGNSFDEGHILPNQSTAPDLALSDYMTKEESYAAIPDDRTLTLRMERRTARVIIHIQKFSDQFDGKEPAVTALTLNSQYAAIPEAGGVTPITPYRTGEGKAGTTYTALVAPGSGDAAAKFLNMTVTYATNQTTQLTVGGIPAAKAGKSYTYDLIVGKDEVKIGSVTIAEWGKGTLTGGEAEITFVVADAQTHTVTNYAAGKMTTAVINEALAGGTQLSIAGPMNKDDFNTIRKCYPYGSDPKELALDLSKADLTEIPDEALHKMYTEDNGEVLSTSLKLTSITLPDKVTHIGNKAFSGCSDLTAFECPPGLESVGEQAFWQTGITELTLPKNMTVINYQAFGAMTKLKTITFKGDITSVGEQAFTIIWGTTSVPLTIDFSNCTNVPTTLYPFADRSQSGRDPKTVTIKVKPNLVDAFKQHFFLGQCTIEAVQQP